MPSLLGRLRIGRAPVSTSGSLASPQCAEDKNTKILSPTSETASSGGRLRSWFSLRRSRRKERVSAAENQPSGRPPTPTPHLLLSSGNAGDTSRHKVLKRKRPPAAYTAGTSEEESSKNSNSDSNASPNEKSKAANGREGKEVAGSRANETDGEKEKYNLSDEECTRMASIADSVRGLMAQYRYEIRDVSKTPPMSNSDGTPLSPISETDELEPEHEHEHDGDIETGTKAEKELPLQPITPNEGERTPSSDEVTDLDYGELLHPYDLDFGMEMSSFDDDDQLNPARVPSEHEKGGDDDELLMMPRWNPDVAEMVQLEMAGTGGSSQDQESGSAAVPPPALKAPLTPLSPVPVPANALTLDGPSEGRVDDDTIERELAMDEGSMPLDKARNEPEPETATEDELEYYSAPSVPVSSADEDEGEDEDSGADATPGRGIGLHLRGITIASVSSSDSYGSELSYGDSDDNDDTIEGLTTTTPRTPRTGLSPFSERHRLSSQPHPMFRPETIDGPPNSSLKRQRATTLPTGHGQDRALPALPRLLIPSGSDDVEIKECSDPAELTRTIAQLQQEKARLEEALAQANRQIEQKENYIAFLMKQLDKLHSTLIRFVRKEVEGISSSESSSISSVPVIVRAPSENAEVDPVEPITAGPSNLTPTTTVRGGLNPLSTPPATPDRRAAVVALSKDANTGEEVFEEARVEEDTDSTPKPARGLVRRNSAGTSSVLSELGIGRTQSDQMKRRAGSENLRSLTASLS